MEPRNTKHTSRGRPPSLRKKEYRLALRLSSAEYLVISEKAKEATVMLHTGSLARGLYYVRILSETKGQAVRTVSIE